VVVLIWVAVAAGVFWATPTVAQWSGLDQVSEQQTFRYRYWKLRLLVQGEDQMFLVPDTWNAANTTLLVPVDDSVRIQFQFRNLAP
jgi:hypothetical protein